MSLHSETHAASAADAAARLRQVADVRTRVRRAALLPSFALLALGAVLVCHGVLSALLPRDLTLTLGWIAALLVARVALRRQWQRTARRTGVVGATRVRAICASWGVLATFAAIAVGADPLVSAVAATSAVAAFLAGLPLATVAIVGAGLAGDAVLLHGAPRATSELLVGGLLVVVGIVCHKMPRVEP